MPNVRHLVAAAAMLATLGTAAIAEASPPKTMSGWGERAGAQFMGSITRQLDGSLKGYWTIVIPNGNLQPSVCRFVRFKPIKIVGGAWEFDAYGTCWGQYGAFSAANHFYLADKGSPGAGLDAIDVNYYGSTGVAIPGGTLDDGELTFTP